MEDIAAHVGSCCETANAINQESFRSVHESGTVKVLDSSETRGANIYVLVDRLGSWSLRASAMHGNRELVSLTALAFWDSRRSERLFDVTVSPRDVTRIMTLEELIRTVLAPLFFPDVAHR